MRNNSMESKRPKPNGENDNGTETVLKDSNGKPTITSNGQTKNHSNHISDQENEIGSSVSSFESLEFP